MITRRITKVLRGMTFLNTVILIFILGYLVAAPPWAHADIPRYINYQGKLTDAQDNPVNDDISITVRIYDDETAGDLLWTETQTVTVTRGVFSMLLGSTEELSDLDFNSPYWYSVEIESDGEMAPRQRLTTVAYAISADKLDGYDAEDFLKIMSDSETLVTGGANEDVTLDPTGLGNVVIKIDSTSGDFKITDGTTNWFVVDSGTGDVSIAKNLTVSGTSDLRGNISNSTGALTVADALTQTGSSNQVTFGGNVDANSGLDVTGTLTVSGATTLSSGLDMNSAIDLDYSGTSAALDVAQAGSGPAASFTGARVVIGSGTANTNAISAGELYVQGDLEVDGTIYGDIELTGTTNLEGAVISDLTVTGNSDLQGNLAVGGTTTATGAVNFAGGTTYNVDTGGGATFNTLDVTSAELTSGGTDDYSVNITQALNDANAAGGSDVYRGIKVNLTETNTTGWNNVYLMDLQADDTTQFSVDHSGNVVTAGTLNMGSNKITNLAAPTEGTDAATKTYADSVTSVAGGWTDGTDVVYVTTVGDNVGIGTTTPAYTLDVSGTINASTAIKIDGTDVLTSYAESDPSAVLKAPAASQTIQPTEDVVPLTIKGQASADSNVLSIYDAGATPAERIYVDSSGHMRIAEDTAVDESAPYPDSAATLYFGRNSTDNWETIGYDPTLLIEDSSPAKYGKFTFSAPLQVEASSPTGITFVEHDEEGAVVKSRALMYDSDSDEFSFTGGKLKQAFQNLIRNGSFESYRPGGWENHNTTWGTNMDMVENASVAKFETKYLRVLDDSSSLARGMRYRVPLPDRVRGETVTMSVWARAASGTATASIGYSYTQDATDASKIKDISLTADWENFTWTFPDVVTDSDTVVIYVYLYGAGGNDPDSDGISTSIGTTTNSVYVFFDGVTLVQGKLSMDYGPTPILDTGNQIIYGNLAIGANSNPTTGATMPTLVFGEPSTEFYYDGYTSWGMESGQIIYEQLGGYQSGRFMFNKPIRIFPSYETSWGAGFFLGGGVGGPNYATYRTDAYIAGKIEADDVIYAPGINISGNVGIGTVTPSEALHVEGNIVVTGTVDGVDVSALSSTIGALDSADEIITEINTNGTSTINDARLSLDVVNADVNASAAIAGSKISPDFGSQSILTTGNVGIGTTSPGAKLVVDGGNLTLTGTATNRLLLPLNNSAATPTLAFGDGDTGFYESSDDALGVAVSGNRDFLFAANIFAGSGGYAGAVLDESASTTNPTLVPDKQDLTTGIGGSSSGSILSLIAGGTNGLNVISTGNVGIGTDAPLTTLDVAGSTRLKGTATSVLTGTIDPAASTTVTGVGTLFTTELVPGDRITVSGETRTVTAIASATSLTVDSAFTDNANDESPDKLAAEFIVKDSSDNIDLIVKDSGNVGIGTPTPSEVLDVQGNIAVTGTVDGVDVAALSTTIGNLDSADEIITEINTNGTGTINDARLSLDVVNADVNASAAIAGSKISPNFGSQNILTTGNAGIGTATPGVKLHVYNTSTNDAKIRVERQTNGAIGDIIAGNTTVEGFGLQTVSGSRLFLTVSGAVGSPDFYINSSGEAVFANSIKYWDIDAAEIYPLLMRGQETAGSKISLGFNGGAWGEYAKIQGEITAKDAGDNYEGSLNFWTGGVGTYSAPANRMTIAASGNVGIGTTTPLSTLHARGNLTAALPNTATSSGTTVTSTAHGLAVGDAVKMPTGASAANEIFSVASITDADNFVVDSMPTNNLSSATTIYSDPSLFKIDNGDGTARLTIDKSGDLTLSGGDIIGAGTTAIDLGESDSDTVAITGNLQIGSGTQNITMNGNDVYIGGDIEVDGANTSIFAGNVEIQGTLTANNLSGTVSASGTDNDSYTIDADNSSTGETTLVLGGDTGSTGKITTQVGNLVIDPAGTSSIVLEGNVGIGTTVPGAKLEVDGGNLVLTGTATNRILLPLNNSAATPTLAFGDGDTGFYESADDQLRFTAGGASTWLFTSSTMGSASTDKPTLRLSNATATNPNIVPDGDDPNTGLGSAANDSLALIAGGVNVLNALSTGRVGIGTTTPLTTLDIAGSSRIKGTATSVLTGTIDPAASTTVTGVGTLFTTELVPGDRITVTGETRTVTAIASATSLTVDSAFTDNANDESPDKLAAEFIVKDSSDNIDLIVKDDGNIGIGTTVPSSNLSVYGDLALGTGASDANTYIWFDGMNEAIYWDDDGSVTLGGNNAGHFVINDSLLTAGNIGIGTATPSEALDVQGNIAVTGTVDGVDVAALSSSIGALDSADEIITEINTNGTGTINDARLSLDVVNADVNASAAIAGSKISPDFGSQNIVTTGNVGIGTTTASAKLTTLGSMYITNQVTAGTTGETASYVRTGGPATKGLIVKGTDYTGDDVDHFVALGQGTNAIAYSSNGIDWTGIGTSIFSTAGYSVAYNGTIWVSVGSGTNTIAYSSNGIDWTGIGTSIFSTAGYGAAWNGTMWVALGEGTNTIAYSSNGIDWTGIGTSIFSTRGQGLAWNGTMWVALGQGTNTIAYSSNGIDWTGVGTSIFSGYGRRAAWNGTMWVAVGNGTNTIAYSSNGIDWTGVGTSIFNTYGLGVAWNGTMWVAVGGTPNSIGYSSNGVDWTGVGTSIFSTYGWDIASAPAPELTPAIENGVGGTTTSQSANLQEWQDTGGSILSVIDSSGYIGIGTGTPSEALDVQGNIAVTGTVDGVDVAALSTTIGNLDSADEIITEINTNGTGTINDARLSLDVVNADVNASAAIAGSKISPDFGSQNIVTTGNVGIGTTNPVQTLTVNSNSGSNYVYAYLFTDSNYTYLGSSRSVLIEPYPTGGRNTIIRGNSGSLYLNDNTAANLLVNTGGGKVGIGTASPLTKLDVAGSGRIKGTATSVLTGTIDPAASTTVTGVGTLFTTELVPGDRITVTGETRTVTAIASATSLTVDSAFTDNANDESPDKLAAEFIVKDSSDNIDLIVKDSGNVGIGTASPSVALDVTGDINLTGTLYQDGVEFSGGYWTQSGTYVYYSDGNVGIGTATPSEVLDVQGNIAVTGTVDGVDVAALNTTVGSLDSADEIITEINANGTGTINDARLSLDIVNADVNASAAIAGSKISPDFGAQNILTTGNVGIGTDTPTEKLDVNGNLYLSGGDLKTDRWLTSDTNTFIGVGVVGAGNLAHTTGNQGYYNIAIGNQALYSNTTGGANLAIGYKALYTNTEGGYNTGLGYRALEGNTTGTYNIAFGYQALLNNNTGSQNAAIGYAALQSNTTGSSNFAIGSQALYSNTEGINNVAIGYVSLNKNTTASNNTAVGYSAIPVNTTGTFNSGVGSQNLTSNVTGNYNSALGYKTLYANTTGTGNLGLGYQADFYVPVAVTTATADSGSGLEVGSYRYRVSYVLDGVETALGANKTVTTTTGNQLVNLAGIPTYSGPKTCSSRKIYRTKVTDLYSYYLLATIANNTTTTYEDTTADASLTTLIDDPDYSIMLGYNAQAFGSNQLVIGSSDGRITDAYIGGGVYDSSPADLTIHSSGASGTDTAGASLILAGGMGTGTGAGGSLIFKTAAAGGSTGSSQNALSNAMIIDSAGNVGIGTDTPSEKLHVEGNLYLSGSFSGSFTIPASNITAGTFGAGNYTFPDNLTVQDNAYLATASGNVGIGTDSPTLAKLVINGKVGNTAAIFGDAKPLVAVADIPSLGFNAYYDAGWKVFSGGSYTGAIDMDTTTGNLRLRTGNNPASAGDAATISTRITIEQAGNVGIGTTTPGGRLEVMNADASYMRYTSTGNLSVNDPEASTGEVRLGSAWDDPGVYSSGNLFLASGSTSYNVYLTTGDSSAGTTTNARMTILGSSGNVGIGTTTPGQRLDVQGGSINTSAGIMTGGAQRISSTGAGTFTTGTFSSNIATQNGVTTTFQSANNYSGGFNVQKRGTTGDATAAVANSAELGYNSFYGWDGTAYSRGAFLLAKTTQGWTDTARGTRFEIDVTANNTTTPSVAFNLDQDKTATMYGNAVIQGTTGLTLSGDAANMSFSSATGPHQITTGGTTHLALMAGGNVGIGTATPSEVLHVQGNIAVTGTVDGVDVAALSSSIGALDSADEIITEINTNGTGTINDARLSLDVVNADVNASAAIAGSKISPDFGSQNILTTGNVGIGTTTPGDRFVVSDGTNDYLYTDNANNRVKVGISEDTTPSETFEIAGNLNFDAVAEADNSFTLTGTTGGNLDTGALYWYSVTFVTANGSTKGGSMKSIDLEASQNKVEITGIPVSSDPRVTARKIYRTLGGASSGYRYLVHTINDNTTTSWDDDVADGSLVLTDTTYRKDNSTVRGLYLDGTIFARMGESNVSYGNNALGSLTTGTNNVACGTAALYGITTGLSNAALGYASGGQITTGNGNIAIGEDANKFNQEGDYNIAIGNESVQLASAGSVSNNIGLGLYALYYIGNGNQYNIAIGRSAGHNFQGSYNTFLGHYAGNIASATAIGDYNTFIGYDVGDNAAAGADNNILIGKELDLQDSDGDNQLSIGNLIFATGLDGTGTTVSSGNVGIGTATPSEVLHVEGNIAVTGTVDGVDVAALNTTVGSLDSADEIITEINANGTGTINDARLSLDVVNADVNASAAIAGSKISPDFGAQNILTTGNVGIGTDTPGVELDVNGTIRASAITLTTAGKVVLQAEYPTAILKADTSNANGIMTSSNTGSTAWMNYYDWTSSSGTLQGYSIIVRYTLPPDFTSWATSDAIRINFCTEAAASANCNLDIDVYLDGASTADASAADNYSAVAETWETESIDDSDLGEWDAAGESGVIILHVQSASSTYVRVGDVELNYNR